MGTLKISWQMHNTREAYFFLSSFWECEISRRKWLMWVHESAVWRQAERGTSFTSQTTSLWKMEHVLLTCRGWWVLLGTEPHPPAKGAGTTVRLGLTALPRAPGWAVINSPCLLEGRICATRNLSYCIWKPRWKTGRRYRVFWHCVNSAVLLL